MCIEVGERIYPEFFNQAYEDHRNRYYFALKYIRRDSKILDISCGSGYGTDFMSKNSNCSIVIGVDKSREALEWAKKYFLNEKCKYIECDIENSVDCLFEYGDFDLVTCFETIEHLVDDKKFIKKLYNLLKKGGKLLISSPNEDVIPFERNPFFDNGKNPFHYRHYTYKQLTDLLENEGFQIIKSYTQENEIVEGNNLPVLFFVCKKP
ncbi:MAG TPA: class I SAM-dependent methyltransferase [Bacillales bacterium]|nr:class I SAM-dependent methyltransferase [Bacillales bacterium]